MSARRQHRSEDAWLEGGTETCAFCERVFHYEAGYHCAECDRIACPICIVIVLEPRTAVCPQCTRAAAEGT